MSLHKLRSKEMRCMRNLEDALQDYRESSSHVSGIGDPNTYCACIPYMYTVCIAASCKYQLWTSWIIYGQQYIHIFIYVYIYKYINCYSISLANTLCSCMVILYHLWYEALLEPDALTLSSYRGRPRLACQP